MTKWLFLAAPALVSSLGCKDSLRLVFEIFKLSGRILCDAPSPIFHNYENPISQCDKFKEFCFDSSKVDFIGKTSIEKICPKTCGTCSESESRAESFSNCSPSEQKNCEQICIKSEQSNRNGLIWHDLECNYWTTISIGIFFFKNLLNQSKANFNVNVIPASLFNRMVHVLMLMNVLNQVQIHVNMEWNVSTHQAAIFAKPTKFVK